jgi:hypothetical protein
MEPQAISYFMEAVEECTLEVTLVEVAILGGRTIVKYVEILSQDSIHELSQVREDTGQTYMYHTTQQH